MATLVEIDGRWRIQFKSPALGKRVTLYTGLTSRQSKRATDLKVRIERMVDALAHDGKLDRESEAWAKEVGPDLRDKLERLGLLPPEDDRPKTLGELLDLFLENQEGSVAESTMKKLRTMAGKFRSFFGDAKRLDSFRTSDGQDFRTNMLKARRGPSKLPYAESHIRKTCCIAAQVFAYGIERGCLEKNPFATVPKNVLANQNIEYVSKEDFAAVLAAAPDDEFRCLLGLVRYAGLRHPSETHELRWTDVSFATSRITVTNVKTKRLSAPQRETPIIPELRPLLENAKEGRAPTEHILRIHRRENNRSLLEGVIERSGIDQWGKLFQTLRASCDTDFGRQFPIAACAAWLGHTPRVALMHYQRATEADFANAAAGNASSNASSDVPAKTASP